MSDGSWEMAECPSSGPSSSSVSRRLSTSMCDDASLSEHESERDTGRSELGLKSVLVPTQHECDPDELSESFAERCFRYRRGRHPGKGDARKREMQAIRHETDDINQVFLLKGAKKLAKIQAAKDTAKKEKRATRYRVEERKFKRRYRDWCCFGNSGVAKASASATVVMLYPGFALLHRCPNCATHSAATTALICQIC